MKRADLEKNKGKKIERGINFSPTRSRLNSGDPAELDRREQRKRDQALGLVPFAVKLDGELIAQLHTLAQTRGRAMNELVAELLKKGLRAE